MQHLIIEFNHQIEDVIPYCEFIQKLKPHLEDSDVGHYLGDDMALDGGDAEVVFECRDAKKLFEFVTPLLKTLPFMTQAKATLIFGPLGSKAEECTVYLNQ
ncbi:MAG: hypothetical protein K1Y36_28975 [Blastocatellia bacterium]|nr:hypothetical protein [Blastocatellia bacterium]